MKQNSWWPQKSGIKKLIVTLTMIAQPLSFVNAEGGKKERPIKYSRPPQYVAFAFDGSYSLGMWDQTMSLAEELNKNNKPIKFTYFISAVYYVSGDKKANPIKGMNEAYNVGAKHGIGKSAIGWGDNDKDVAIRFAKTRAAYNSQHEIGSHAVGHWDGSDWTESEWRKEFQFFNNIIFASGTPLADISNQVIGFRAPQLGYSKGLWPILKENKYTYDTSQTSEASYWPEKKASSNTWVFPLADLIIAGTNKRTLSMDYNFYMAQSNANETKDEAKNKLYEEQMYQTYLQYFEKNYYGNRAPVHIGHHFSLWNGGAYWKAFQRFANTVCGLEEVKCVNYAELTNEMDKLTSDEIKDYRDGVFQKMPLKMKLASNDLKFKNNFNLLDLGSTVSSGNDKDKDPLEAHNINTEKKLYNEESSRLIIKAQ